MGVNVFSNDFVYSARKSGRMNLAQLFTYQ